MTIRKSHDGDDSMRRPRKSLRERAVARHLEKSVSEPDKNSQFLTDEGQQTLHELQVHQIELEMQNEELRISQLALEESRARYLDLYDCAPVGYCLVSTVGLIQEANRTLASMLGTSSGNLLRDRFSKFIDENDQDTFYLLRRRLLASSEPQTCELRLQKSDGTRRWVQLTVSLTAGDVEAAPLRVILMDIDPRIQAESAKASLEAQLRESQKMEAIGTLAGGIAHDFNNILAVILGNAELARHFRSETNPQTFHCIEEIYKASERARDLVRQLLAFCRRQPTDRKSISLTPIIEESISLLRSTMPARVNLSFTSSPDVPYVLADFTQIQQVIINLATNAVQAMNSKPGSIKIHLDTLERRSDHAHAIPNWHIAKLESAHWQNCDKIVRLTINDDGPGMDATVSERVFEPFFTTKPVDEGTGLGLAVVHGIVRAHDGEITVDSHPGRGATFTIYFPAARTIQFESAQGNAVEPNDSEKLLTRAALESPTASICNILYLDDDEMVLKSIVSLLGLHGFQVRGYSDQLTALNALRVAENHFDILVTDYNMPGLSGLDVAKQVRNIRPDLPVIVTSGHIDHELHTHADEAGVSALISKPFAAEYFCKVVQQLLPPNETIKTNPAI